MNTVTCPEGISPRMNYFKITENSNYITLNDNNLFLLNDKCEIIWESSLGYNIIPEQIYSNSVGIFVVISDIHGSKSIYYDYSNSAPVGIMSVNNIETEKTIAVIAFKNGNKFTPGISDMKNITDTDNNNFSLNEKASLVFVDEAGNSLWEGRQQKKEESFYLFDNEGTLIKQRTVVLPDISREETGFWTIVKRSDDGEYIIYKNVFYDDYIEIRVYGF